MTSFEAVKTCGRSWKHADLRIDGPKRLRGSRKPHGVILGATPPKPPTYKLPSQPPTTDVKLPDPHVYGETVLSLLFDVAPVETAEVYWTQPAPLADLRAAFPAISTARIEIQRIRAFVLNCDYWVLLPDESIVSLLPDLPVARTLSIAGALGGPELLRALHLAASYPWEKVDFDLEDIREAAFEFSVSELATADVAAMKLGYPSAAALVKAPER